MASQHTIFQPYTAAACEVSRSVPAGALCIDQAPNEDLDTAVLERQREKRRDQPLARLMAEGLVRAVRETVHLG